MTSRLEHSMGPRAAVVGLFLTLALFAIEATGAEFRGLGDVPGGAFLSQAQAVSDDGSVVIGISGLEGEETAFRWTEEGGIVSLGSVEGDGKPSRAFGLSADGSVVVGRSVVGDEGVFQAFRWTAEGGMQSIGNLGGVTPFSEAFGVSADGNVVVGRTSTADSVVRAFRWDKDNGMIDLGDLPGGLLNSVADSISADGQVVVGSSSSTLTFLFNEAIVWTEQGGLVPLGTLQPGTGVEEAVESGARAASDDGSVVVGRSSLFVDKMLEVSEAFIWTEEGGLQGLGFLGEQGRFSQANDVSGDGTIVVGEDQSTGQKEAFIWTEQGLQNLQTMLQDEYNLGGALAGWELEAATSISSDGNFIVGFGTNPEGQTEAWLVSLLDDLLPGDANSDGKVDLADFNILKLNFGASDATLAEGDLDGDTFVNLADFNILKTNFGASAAQVPEPSTWALGLLALFSLAPIAIRKV